MATATRFSVWWSVKNLLGIVAFLALASAAWIEPELANEPGASGASFIVWGITALPVLLVYLLAHLIAVGITLRSRRRSWMPPLLITTTWWVAAFLFDNAHHGI